MADQTNAEVSDERLRELIERLARSFAVAYVDGRHGYTMEFAPSPAAHRDEYDQAESYSRIVLETEFRMDKPMAAALNRRSVTSQASEGAWQHKWVKSNLGHGETMCEYCRITNREAAVLGEMNACSKAPASPSKRVERLETALKDAEAELFEAEDKFWVAHCNYPNTTKPSFAAERQGQDKAFLATMSDRMKAARERARQALGGRS